MIHIQVTLMSQIIGPGRLFIFSFFSTRDIVILGRPIINFWYVCHGGTIIPARPIIRFSKKDPFQGYKKYSMAQGLTNPPVFGENAVPVSQKAEKQTGL